MTNDPNDLQFPVGPFLSVAFMAWDGGAGETGSKMAFASWYYLRLEEPGSTKPYLIPPLAFVITVALEWLAVRRARRRAQGGGSSRGTSAMPQAGPSRGEAQ